jgi:hypothetical protein
MLCAVILSITVTCVILLSKNFAQLSAATPTAIALSVIRLGVIMLSVVAP